MHGWPDSLKKTLPEKYFATAEELLHVQDANAVDSNNPEWLQIVSKERPVYGVLQDTIGKLMGDVKEVDNVYRAQPAPLASNGKTVNRIDFQKFSVPGELLALASKQASLHDTKQGSLLHIATDCTVEKIHQQGGIATALKTSRGVIPIGDADLVLAMGTLPPATLIRNSFPDIYVVKHGVGERFSAHFISSVIARIPREDYEASSSFGDLEIGAFYIAGTAEEDYRKQFHIQMSVLSDKDPENNAQTALRYMPDVVATASMQQLKTSKDYVVFVCAVLGELDANNPDSWFRHNNDDQDITTNSILRVTQNENDKETWNAMDQATFEVLENALSPKGKARVQYWHGAPNTGDWTTERPSPAERRVDALVHESSTLYIGEESPAPVDLDYRLRGTQNVYITGGGLWPLGGSWNPTMVMVAMAQHLADKLSKQTKKKELKAKKGFLRRLGEFNISKYLPHW